MSRHSIEVHVTLARAMGKLFHALVGRAFGQWVDMIKMANLCRKVMRRLIYRQTMVLFLRWQKATRVGRRLRQDARLKAAQIEVDQQNRLLQQQVSHSFCIIFCVDTCFESDDDASDFAIVCAAGKNGCTHAEMAKVQKDGAAATTELQAVAN